MMELEKQEKELAELDKQERELATKAKEDEDMLEAKREAEEEHVIEAAVSSDEAVASSPEPVVEEPQTPEVQHAQEPSSAEEVEDEEELTE